MNQGTLPTELQSEQNTINSMAAAARQATQDAAKAQTDLNRRIREYFSKDEPVRP